MTFDAGSIKNTLGLDMSGFATGMLQATSIASLFPATVTNFMANPLLGLIGIAKDAAAALKEAFTSSATRLDDMGEAAERAGVTVEFFSTVSAAAKDAGVGVGEFEQSLIFLNRSMNEANQGKQETIASFNALGITLGDLKGLSTEQLFFRIADGMKSVQDQGARTALAMDLLGRGGSAMLGFLAQGSTEIQTWADYFGRAGALVTAEQAAMADQAKKVEAAWGYMWDKIKVKVSEPIFQFIGDHFEEISQKILDFGAKLGNALVKIVQVLVPFLTFILDNFETLMIVLGTLAGAAAGFQVGGPWGALIGAIGGGAAGAFVALQPGATSHTYNINAPVSVDSIDTNEVSDSIARKIHGPLSSQIRERMRQLNGEAASKSIREGL